MPDIVLPNSPELTHDKARIKAANEGFLDALQNDPKKASTVASRWVRMYLRETAFMRGYIGVDKPEALIPCDTSDEVYTLIYKEPPTATAVSIPFGAHSSARTMRADRIRVYFHRVNGTKYVVPDVFYLKAYPDGMDIRQIIADNTLKEIEYQEDARWIQVINNILGSAGSTSPWTGKVMYRAVGAAMSRQTLPILQTMLRQCANRLSAGTALMNFITELELETLDRNAAGGDIAETTLINGWTQTKLLGMNVIYTSKCDIIPDGAVYVLAPSEFFGAFYEVEEATMYIKAEDYRYSMFPSEIIGGALVNAASVGRVDYDMTLTT